MMELKGDFIKIYPPLFLLIHLDRTTSVNFNEVILFTHINYMYRKDSEIKLFFKYFFIYIQKSESLFIFLYEYINIL